jgi:hypothetical protein
MCSSRKMTSVISGLLGASIYLFKRLYDLEQSRGDCAFPLKVFFFFFPSMSAKPSQPGDLSETHSFIYKLGNESIL